MYWSCSGTRCLFKTMRWLLDLTLLLSVLSIVKAFPATKNDPPITIIDEDVVEDSLGPVPNFPKFLKQDDGPHQQHALVMDEKSGPEEDDLVILKRRPFQDQAAWPKTNGIVQVPYTATGVDTDVLKRAIEVFNAKTCIRFVPRESQSSYVQFQSGSSCGTLVGFQHGGMQSCDLTSGCAAKKGKVMHEMMHVLGFLHEQCRPDRDSYVTVHTDRIKTAALSNFDKVEGKDLGISYDCDSILHYRSAAFAKVSGQETITSLSSDCPKLGNDDTRLSIKDYKRVNTFYSCGKPDYKYYKVVVVTDDTSLSGAGTDCYIYLTLHGSSQSSTEFELDLSTNPSANLFETGSTDTFNYMAYRNDLGSINGISVRMVAHGSGQAWWPNTFTVTDPASGTSVTFTNSKWLSPSSTYGTSNFPTQ